MKKLLSILFLIIILLPLFNGCNLSYCSEVQWGYSNGEFNRYDFSTNLKTPLGTAYDPSGQPISPLLIDRLTKEVETCLSTAYSNGELPDDVIHNSYCFRNSFQLPINPQSFEVKIPDDWILNCSGTQQELPAPVEAGPTGCFNKGETPTTQCPCRWRAGIKCPNILIVTPSFYLYKDVLIRFVTGCQNPWATTQLANCASPSTTPLSDGTDPNNGL